MNKWLLIVLIAVTPTRATFADSAFYTVCVDTNFWAPYTFILDGDANGLHVEIATRAFDQLQLNVRFTARPWKRCLSNGQSGQFDAVLSAGHHPTREPFFYYPADAQAPVSNSRVTQVEYVVVVRTADFFDWNGQDSTLPQPIGLPLGYADASTLPSRGITVKTATKYSDLFLMLARGRVNALILPHQTARMYMDEQDYETALSILDRPMRSSSYFMIVSKNGNLDQQDAFALWHKISSIRDNKKLMAEIASTVKQQLETCFKAKARCNY